MGYIVRMPKLGLEMEQGTLLEWAVEEGGSVAEGDLVAEVESEKSIGEVEAREDGVLRRVYLEEEGTVPPGTPIGIVAEAEADIADLEAEAEADLAEADAAVADTTGGASEASEAATPDREAATGAGAATDSGTEGGAAGTGGGDSGTSTGDVKASPRAEKRAEELGVDLTAVEGTGPGGAVTAEDVEAAAEGRDGGATAGADEEGTAEVKASPRAEKRAGELGVDLTAVDGTGPGGAVTADDVEAAAESAPTDSEAAETGGEPESRPAAAAGDVGDLRRIQPGETFRYGRTTAVASQSAAEGLFGTTEAVRSAFEERVTMTDVLAVVASAALAEHPHLNGTYAGGTHHVRETQRVALVVDVDGEPAGGVIPDLAAQSVTDIVDARESLTATEGVAADQPPTFTLVDASEAGDETALLAEPGVAALEVDPTGQRAVPGSEGVELHSLVTAGLTYDTRALDQRDAQQFLETFLEYADEASSLVLDSYRGSE